MEQASNISAAERVVAATTSVPPSGPRAALGPIPSWARVAEASGREFVMAMPVPNITGTLHMGHALDLCLQDAVVRHRAQHGDVIYFPSGTDHAGLNAQWAAERELHKTGASREELGRAGFAAHMLAWKERHEQRIVEQMQALAVLANFEQRVHSIDTRRRELCEAAFRRLHELRLVYRERALVNWCPRCGTCVGAVELERRECHQTLYRIRLAGHGVELELGTLHLELMLGATALGLPSTHPAFAQLLGKKLDVPIIERSLSVVEAPHGTRLDAYATLVLPSYNAHHFDEAVRQGGAFPEIYDERGRIAAEHGVYAGMEPAACAAVLAERLEATHSLLAREPYLQGDAYHRLCDTLVRPRPTAAWFVRQAAFAEAAKQLAHERAPLCNHPSWDEKLYASFEALAGERRESGNRWWEGACLAIVQDFSSNRDWIISRQNWWGYRVPAWHCASCSEVHVGEQAPPACLHCGGPALERDPDVFDVLFHSALWGYLVGEDAAREPHSDCAGLGADVLEFWLATAQVWARALYGRRSLGRALVHGLICDEQGRKLSKSLGNAPDLDHALHEYGSDAVRAAVFSAMCGNDAAESIPFPPDALSRGAHWCQRLERLLAEEPRAQMSEASRSELTRHIERVRQGLDQYRIGEAYEALRALVDALAGGALGLDSRARRDVLRTLYPFHPALSERVQAMLP